ncbi:M24 family metallopeptidase [Candidatus Bipolaricaulota bacterium]
MYLTTGFHEGARNSLIEKLQLSAMEGMLVLDPFNVNYLSGFYHIPSERPIGIYIPVNGESVLFVPRLEKEHAQHDWTGELRVYPEYPGKVNPLLWMCKQIAADKLAVDNISGMCFQTILSAKPAAQLSGHVGDLRLIKDSEEMKFVTQAARYADFSVASARQAIAHGYKDGITEREVLEHLKHETLKKMQQDHKEHPDYPLSCGATVHAGELGALPHGLPTGRPIGVGDTVIVGVGAGVAGYHAESACTFMVGEPSSDQQRWMDTALAIRNLAVREIKPGVPCGQVDDLHLKLVRHAGMEEFNRHRLGHGIGLQNHEAPWLQSGDRRPLEPGMVVSSEPGIYVPGKGGIRLIDTLVLTEEGNCVVSRYMAEHLDDYVIHV